MTFLKKIFGLFHGLIYGASRAGYLIATFCLLLVLTLTVEQVVSRYFFNSSQVALQELQWHLFGFLITLSIAYTLEQNGHVRVDILSNKFGWRLRRFTHALGFLILVPLCLTLAYFGWQDVVQARSYTSPLPEDYYSKMIFGESEKTFFRLVSESLERVLRQTILVGEGSSDAGGLEARWLIKAAFPVGMILLAFQAFSLFLRCFQPSTSLKEKYSWL